MGARMAVSSYLQLMQAQHMPHQTLTGRDCTLLAQLIGDRVNILAVRLLITVQCMSALFASCQPHVSRH